MTISISRPGRSAVWIAVTVLLAAVACSVEETLPIPHCERGDSALIVAQSVPTADLVPCLDPLPRGWETASISIDQGGTVVRIDSDRAGEGAARLRFEVECDLADAISVPSDLDGADRFEYIERVEPGFRAQRYYTFSGGCVWWEFDFDDEATAALSIELGNRLQLFTRESINENIREDFIDAEL